MVGFIKHLVEEHRVIVLVCLLARLGEGHIGLTALKRLINHPALAHLPFYLETPNDLAGYAKEIDMMREAWKY